MLVSPRLNVGLPMSKYSLNETKNDYKTRRNYEDIIKINPRQHEANNIKRAR
jgi:hypothetical protein